MEDGKGRERDEVLAKLNIDTFLIIPPKQQVKLSLVAQTFFTFFPIRIDSKRKDPILGSDLSMYI